MLLRVSQFISILTAALAGGMFWGPWLALTVSIRRFSPEIFLALVAQLSRNIGAVMKVLLPLALLLMVPVLVLTHGQRPTAFYCTLGGLVLYAAALLVTVRIEVPLVKQMERWTVDTLPPHWTQVRDRWASFHIVRVVTAVAGLGLLIAGALAH